MNNRSQTRLSDPERSGQLSIGADLTAGLVVFLVALPLCLGIALASGAPLFSGLIAGIVGGLVVGAISGSHTSVSGPAAGLTAIVITQIEQLGSFEAFLLAVVFGGVLQLGLAAMRAGSLSAFFPSSVIKGLLAAIGVILVLKQIPHLLGHDTDPEGDLAFRQPDNETTFSEFGRLINGEVHAGAIVVGVISILVLVVWGRTKFLRNSLVPGPLVVVLTGVGVNAFFKGFGDDWVIGGTHLVNIPVGDGDRHFPDFSQWINPQIYMASITIAIVASLETLLNLHAVDKLDRLNRSSPANQELLAQGVGNIVSGLLGGLPLTSVIIRGSANVNAGARTKLSTIFHGLLLLVSVLLLPQYLNQIPKSALAAILLVTGFKLASPSLFRQMWRDGRYQFIPFIVTLGAIVCTDLLIGIVIGLGVSVLFILNSNLRHPVRRIVRTHLVDDVLHVELANQVSFLNRAAIAKLLDDAPDGSYVVIDGSDSDYIDPDILTLIRDFRDDVAPIRNVTLSLKGFRSRYGFSDESETKIHSTRELQEMVTPEDVLKILQEGNRRFCSGLRLNRDLSQQMVATAGRQNPLAVVLSSIDSRVPVEMIFDLGIGNTLSVRVAGNVLGSKSLGSIEYGVVVAGVRLIVVMGHTRCGVVASTVELLSGNRTVESQTDCSHLQAIIDEIEPSVDRAELKRSMMEPDASEAFIQSVVKQNVLRTVDSITDRSEVVRKAVEEGRILVIGAMYDVSTGRVEFLSEVAATSESSPAAD